MLKIFTPLSVSHHVCANEWIMKYVFCVSHLVPLIPSLPPEKTPGRLSLPAGREMLREVVRMCTVSLIPHKSWSCRATDAVSWDFAFIKERVVSSGIATCWRHLGGLQRMMLTGCPPMPAALQCPRLNCTHRVIFLRNKDSKI